MLAKAWNDFSTPTRKHSCRSSSCANECLRCASVNRPFVLNCRRSLTRPTIGQPSCDWRRLSRRSSHACAVPLRRLMSRSASESSGFVVKDVLVGDNTITIRHSIPVPSGPPQNGGSPPSRPDGQNYLLRKGSERAALRRALIHRTHQSILHHTGLQKRSN